MLRKITVVTFIVLLLVSTVGCVTVQQRDQHTIDSLVGLRSYVKGAMTDAADKITDPTAKQEVLDDRDTVDIEFDSIITYEEAKEDKDD